MELHRLGADAVLVEVDDTAAASALYRVARERAAAARDIVPAARTVLFDGVADVEALVIELSRWRSDTPPTTQRDPVEVPTTYDGPDLAEVARLWDMTGREVVATHTQTEFVVAFCGFAPGFAYCTGLPERLAVPRRDDPRVRVDVGAVGLAGEFTGIYPTASPGGWQIVGRTDLTLWDPTREEPATLPPGTPVRFVEV